MNRREIDRLLEAVRLVRTRGERAALATIVRVVGNAYRREGTRMLVRRDGTYECALSGGCLEPAVAEAARQVIDTGSPAVVNYDLADDSLWGLGMGCSGAIDVRIERLDEDETTRRWLDVLDANEAAVLVTPLAGAPGALIVREAGLRVGRLGDSSLEREAVERALTRLRARFPRSGTEWIGSRELFFEVSTPAPQLVIFGAGPDASPLARDARALGFAVTVVDVRGAYLTEERFPNAALVTAHFDQFASEVPLSRRSWVVVMNHHAERDEESLRFALDSEAPYIGVLGPRARYERLLEAMAAKGHRPQPSRLSVVRSPVGLALGAETPEEVSLSILGEILAVERGFAGGFLSGSSESLHRPADRRVLTRS